MVANQVQQPIPPNKPYQVPPIQQRTEHTYDYDRRWRSSGYQKNAFIPPPPPPPLQGNQSSGKLLTQTDGNYTYPQQSTRQTFVPPPPPGMYNR